MNPMQGPRSIGGSSTEVNQVDGESIYCTETSLNTMLNPADTGFPNNSTPSGRPTYASSSSHAAQDHTWWRFGESSSIPGPSDQVNSIGIKTSHQLPQDGTHHFVGYGSEGRQTGLNGMMVDGGVHAGLSEEVILKAMKQHKHTSSSPSSVELHQNIEPCCICQEEYVEGDNLGTLKCGHEFHKDCIKQWVMIKNLCPICKTEALKTP